MPVAIAVDNEPMTTEAERKLERYEFAERVLRCGHWRIDFAGGKPTWSPGLFLLSGAEPSDVAPSPEWLRYNIHPADRDMVRANVDSAVRERRGFSHRFRARGPNLEIRWFDTRAEVERGASGEPIALIGVCQDVTDLVNAESEHLRALERYRLMAEEASDIISLHAVGGDAHIVSSSFERVHGIKAADVNMRALFDRVHHEDIEEAAKLKRRPGPEEVISATYRTRHADGSYFWIETSARSIYDQVSGEPRYVVAVSRNVDERIKAEIALKDAQERAETANRAKSDFLANMSHELRTPLNAILGFADLMRTGVLGPIENSRYAEYVNLIYDSGQLLLDLITDILDMAKIEAGKMEYKLEAVDLNGMVGDCLRLMEGRAQSAKVNLCSELPGGNLSLTADRRAVKQILLNLLSNAVKFTNPGGSITVAITCTTDGICMAVRDTGIGIPADQLPRLGRRFEQVSSNAMLAKGGTGLGLALVHAFTEGHGGKVKIESVEGKGTTVTVALPLVPPAAAEGSAQAG